MTLFSKFDEWQCVFGSNDSDAVRKTVTVKLTALNKKSVQRSLGGMKCAPQGLVTLSCRFKSEFNRSQRRNHQTERQPNTTSNLYPFLICRSPVEQVSQTPGRNGKPNSSNNHQVSAGLDYQCPPGVGQSRATRIHH